MITIDIAKIASPAQKRYETDFKELGKIGKGGFSKVYKVQNQVDNQMYAIKKVELKVKDIKDNFQIKLERVLREARYLARLCHPQIIRYYNSWVEVTEAQKPPKSSENCNVSFGSKTFGKKTKTPSNGITQFSHWANEITERDQEIIFYFDSKNSNKESHDSINQGSMDNLIEFQPRYDEDTIHRSPQFYNLGHQQTVKRSGNVLEHLSKPPRRTLGDIDKLVKFPTPSSNEHISYSEFELSNSNDDQEPCFDLKSSHRQPRQSMKDFKLNMKKSISQECKNVDDKKKNSSLDQFEKVIIYIQTEICDKTLEEYITQRNQMLNNLKRTDKIGFEKALEDKMKEATQILKQIIEGLGYIHKNRLIHRDLKPGNIFMNNDNQIKIGDFGLVKKIEKLLAKHQHPLNELIERESSGQIVEAEDVLSDGSSMKGSCTKLYASPEQIDLTTDKMRSYDHRMDIHALGMIIMQLFHPMNTSMEIVKTMQDARKGILPKQLSSATTQIIGKCLQRDPSSRPSLDEIVFTLCDPCQLSATTSAASTQVSYPSRMEVCPSDRPTRESIGLLDVEMEGTAKVKQRYCQLLNRQFLIYKDPLDSKAQYNYNLEECKVAMLRQNSLSEVHIQHHLQVECVIYLQDEDLAGSLFRKLHFGFVTEQKWQNHEHYYESD